MPLTGTLKQIDSGPYGAVWCADIAHYAYKWNDNTKIWEFASGGLKHVSSGEGGVWGTSDIKEIFYREGNLFICRFVQ